MQNNTESMLKKFYEMAFDEDCSSSINMRKEDNKITFSFHYKVRGHKSTDEDNFVLIVSVSNLAVSSMIMGYDTGLRITMKINGVIILSSSLNPYNKEDDKARNYLEDLYNRVEHKMKADQNQRAHKLYHKHFGTD